jgi:hypothetical protein
MQDSHARRAGAWQQISSICMAIKRRRRHVIHQTFRRKLMQAADYGMQDFAVRPVHNFNKDIISAAPHLDTLPCSLTTHPTARSTGNMAPTASSSRPKSDLLRFTGHAHLRQRVLLSILSGKSIRIDGIRSDDVSVGLREYEINLLRLVEKVTNGTTIEISVTGTSFLLHPGLLPGGSYTHTCHVGRSIGYYLEVLVPLGPFCKKPLDVNLYGITGEEGRDMTVSG